MYSLPITTYSDYWRTTKRWSTYLGGLAVLAAGTRYSIIETPIFPYTMQLQSLQTTQFLSSKQLNTDIESLGIQELASNQGLANQRPQRERMVSRGATIQEVRDPMPNEGAGDKKTTSVRVLEKEIPFETKYVESDKLLPGKSQTQEKGENGVLRQVIKVFEVSGQPVDQQVLSNYELRSPKTEVIMRNSKPIPKKQVIVQNSKPVDVLVETKPGNGDLSNLNISRTLNVEATAYTYTGNNTATGVEPREGLIAVDPKVIAMGSKVYVEGYGYATAADTGGSIKGNRIDVFFGTLRQCIDWGRKSVRIHILNPT